MANVRVEQRNAHLASPVRLETVHGREGDVSKATLTAISNSRRGTGEHRVDEPAAIQWTLWGKQAENAARYLVTGSHVNIIGRLRNDHFQDGSGQTVFGYSFTCDEIDYLDNRAQAEERRARHRAATDPKSAPADPGDKHSAATTVNDEDIPF